MPFLVVQTAAIAALMISHGHDVELVSEDATECVAGHWCDARLYTSWAVHDLWPVEFELDCQPRNLHRSGLGTGVTRMRPRQVASGFG